MEDSDFFSWQNFYLGSIHTDLSPIYIYARRFINLFSAAPFINATALVSLILVAAALAFAALVIHRMMGPLWAVGFLLLAWTDRWVMVAAVASSLIPQPMLIAAAGLGLCCWALYRPLSILRPKESWLVGLAAAAGILVSLYSYSGARFNWLCSLGITGLILLVRRAIPLSVSGASLVARIATPSVVLIAVLWVALFRFDTAGFSQQIFTNRATWIFVESPTIKPGPIKPFNDVDVPIWWGSGVDERINHVVYWKRTPRELYERFVRYFWQWAATYNIAPYLSGFATAALLLGLGSVYAIRRHSVALLGIFAIHGYLPIFIAQAPEAYRRGTFNALAVVLLMVSIFASAPRTVFTRIASFLALVAFCLIKAPLELNAVMRTHMDDSLATNVCLSCVRRGELPIKILANSPLLLGVRDREVRFLINDQDIVPVQNTCMKRALNSIEMKELIPHGSMIKGVPGDFKATINSLAPKEILVLMCHSSFKPSPDVISACNGATPQGTTRLGDIPESYPDRWSWWVLLEKL
jgi:hypothetical protein